MKSVSDEGLSPEQKAVKQQQYQIQALQQEIDQLKQFHQPKNQKGLRETHAQIFHQAQAVR